MTRCGWRFTTAGRCDVKLVHHPDRGSQYTSIDYTQELSDHGVLASVGSVGDAYDNAMAESFVASFKAELVADRGFKTRSQLELATIEYIAWFNSDRLHESLGDLPPVEFEGLFGLQGASTDSQLIDTSKPVSVEPRLAPAAGS